MFAIASLYLQTLSLPSTYSLITRHHNCPDACIRASVARCVMLRSMQRMLTSRVRLQVHAYTQSVHATRKYSSNAAPFEENHIKSWKEGQHLGRILIDRPKALNAMSAGESLHVQGQCISCCRILTLASLHEDCTSI